MTDIPASPMMKDGMAGGEDSFATGGVGFIAAALAMCARFFGEIPLRPPAVPVSDAASAVAAAAGQAGAREPGRRAGRLAARCPGGGARGGGEATARVDDGLQNLEAAEHH